MNRLFRTTLILAATALLGGCATTARAPGETPEAHVLVNNEHSTISSLTVDLIPPVGTPQRLGSVELNDIVDFPITRTNLAGRYRLFADPLGGDGFYSPPFTLADGDVVEWDLRTNQIYLRDTVEGR